MKLLSDSSSEEVPTSNSCTMTDATAGLSHSDGQDLDLEAASDSSPSVAEPDTEIALRSGGPGAAVDGGRNNIVGIGSLRRDSSGGDTINSLADPFKKREGRDLTWKNVNMVLAPKHKDEEPKYILKDIWGEVPKGQVTAIMGPSGSGKTSLLNILSGRTRTGGDITVDSDVRLNNYQVDPTDIDVRKKVAFVAQDDSLLVTQTPREAIRFSAKLRLPKFTSEEEIEVMAERMLAELGLMDCSDTLIGGALIKGISGGERKRTSVGVELVSRPALVFLDEPTSGLDSFNAVILCDMLKKVARSGASVLFTIHQPSSDIFSSFDRLILLNKGRIMYQGSVGNVPTYFGERGYPCPTNFNPADWVMSVAISNSVETLQKSGFFPSDDRGMSEAFSAEDAPGKDSLGISRRKSYQLATNGTSLGFGGQMKLLFQRECTNLVRNRHAIRTRAMMTCMISLVMGCIFYNIAETDYDEDFVNVQSSFGALLMALLANVFSTAMPSLLAFPEERPVFLREYSTNHYSVISYFVSRLLMEIVVTGIQVTISSMLTYLLMGFSASFGLYWSGCYLMAMTSTALGVLVGCSVENPSTAVEFLPAIFMPQILFSGFFVPPGLMPDWLAWIRFICPLTYGVRIVVVAEFGYGRCSDESPNNCDRILSNTEVTEEEMYWYFLVLLALFVFIRLLGLFNLKKRSDKFY